jgi:hypothetical protein
MAFPVTNQIASPALKGQCAVVTLTQAASDAYIATLAEGTLCTAASGKDGFIQSVDVFGHSFKVRPRYPFTLFDSTATPGVLNVSEVITIG